jgi:molecular chaperone DnaK
MAKIIGIDLGTTNSVVAYLDEFGRPQVLPADDHHNLMPSVVCFDGEDVHVGLQGKRMAEMGRPGIAAGFKRDMGDDKTYDIEGVQTTPVKLSAMVVRKLADYAVEELGDLDASTVTVPAIWNHRARAATREASVIAGLKIGTMINEPSAAALYYSHNGRVEPGYYYVYDFGGGTWDISYVEIREDILRVITSRGIPKCGGADFDESIRQLVKSKFESQTGQILNEAESGLTPSRYEDLKKELTNLPDCQIRIPYPGSAVTADIRITRDEFEERIKELLVQTEAYCRSMLGSYPDFEDVLLVGGSTRVPKVRESVAKVFGKEPRTVGNPDEAVALGAAIHAAHSAEPSKLEVEQRKIVDGLRFLDVASHYYGTIYLNTNENTRDYNKRLVMTVIPKDTELPCTIIKNVYLQYDGHDKVRVTVTQSGFPEEDPNEVDTAYDGILELEPGSGYENDRVEVIFSYTADEILECSFTHVPSGKSKGVNLSSSFLEERTLENLPTMDDEEDLL